MIMACTTRKVRTPRARNDYCLRPITGLRSEWFLLSLHATSCGGLHIPHPSLRTKPEAVDDPHRQWLTIQVYPSSSHSTNLIPQKKVNAYFSTSHEPYGDLSKAQDANGLAKKATTGGRLHFIKLSMQSQVRLSVSIYSKSMSCAIAADRVVLDIEIA
jgi:hypothetical protein